MRLEKQGNKYYVCPLYRRIANKFCKKCNRVITNIPKGASIGIILSMLTSLRFREKALTVRFDVYADGHREEVWCTTPQIARWFLGLRD